MKAARGNQGAFTLSEALVACGIIGVVGAIIFTALNIAMTLYAQNVSLNQTHVGELFSTERLLAKVAAAAEAPLLVDAAGAVVSGNGPAAGLRIFLPAASAPYAVPSSAGATATSFTITTTAGLPAPEVGDKVKMPDLGFQGLITSVSASGSNYTVGFGTTVGGGFSPAKTAGTVIPAASKCFLLRPAAFIAVNAGLRFYPRSMSVAQHGAPVFNNPASFDPVAGLLPIGAATDCLPFQYLDPARRAIDVSLRVRAPGYGGRIRGFYTFQNVKTTVACRSSVNP